jgi:hypothetical protein
MEVSFVSPCTSVPLQIDSMISRNTRTCFSPKTYRDILFAPRWTVTQRLAMQHAYMIPSLSRTSHRQVFAECCEFEVVRPDLLAWKTSKFIDDLVP